MTRNIIVSALIGPAVGILVLTILGVIAYSLIGRHTGSFEPFYFVARLPEILILGYRAGLVPSLFLGLVNGGFEVAGCSRRTRVIAAPLAGIGIALLLGTAMPPMTFGMTQTISNALMLTAAASASLASTAVAMWLGHRAQLRYLDRMQGIAL